MIFRSRQRRTNTAETESAPPAPDPMADDGRPVETLLEEIDAQPGTNGGIRTRRAPAASFSSATVRV